MSLTLKDPFWLVGGSEYLIGHGLGLDMYCGGEKLDRTWVSYVLWRAKAR